jgi:MFS family permease
VELKHTHYLLINDVRLVGINAWSLFFGVMANLAVMPVIGDGSSSLGKVGLNSLRLIMITIICGFIASFILIALVVATAITLRLPSPPQHAFTQAYYFAVMAAILYFVTSAFIVYTAYMLLRSERTREQIRKQFAQGHRSLKLLTMVFMAYILLGALVFARVEGWGYLDAVFWADVTILTVGFGDFKPETHLGRSLLFPYASCGIFILFLVIYCITNVVFERGKSTWEVRLRDQERIRSVQKRARESSDNIQQKPEDSAAVERESTSKEARAAEEQEARRRDFNTMQMIIVKAARKRILYSMSLWTFFAFFLWLVGAVVFYLAEKEQGWSYFEAIYFTFISILAIGYGDITLHSMFGKAFFVLWSLIVVPSLTMLISTGTEAVGMPYLTGAKKWWRKHVRKKPEETKEHLSGTQSLSDTSLLH